MFSLHTRAQKLYEFMEVVTNPILVMACIQSLYCALKFTYLYVNCISKLEKY